MIARSSSPTIFCSNASARIKQSKLEISGRYLMPGTKNSTPFATRFGTRLSRTFKTCCLMPKAFHILLSLLANILCVRFEELDVFPVRRPVPFQSVGILFRHARTIVQNEALRNGCFCLTWLHTECENLFGTTNTTGFVPEIMTNVVMQPGRCNSVMTVQG